MKIFNCHAILGLLLCCFVSTVFSQEQNQKSISKISTPHNTSVHEKAKLCAEEVFRNCLQYSGEEYLETYIEQISRVNITDLAEHPNISYQPLVSIQLKSKCNPDLKTDNKDTFDKNLFNPLKYQFNFYANTAQYFLIEGTSILIQILPYKAN